MCNPIDQHDSGMNNLLHATVNASSSEMLQPANRCSINADSPTRPLSSPAQQAPPSPQLALDPEQTCAVHAGP